MEGGGKGSCVGRVTMGHLRVVKLRQGLGKDRQGMVNKRPYNLNLCLELTLKLVGLTMSRADHDQVR